MTTEVSDCIDDIGQGECRGEVEYFSPDGRGSAPPRCQHHIDLRMQRYENSIERYAHSDIAPSWHDEGYAGERWFEDY